MGNVIRLCRTKDDVSKSGTPHDDSYINGDKSTNITNVEEGVTDTGNLSVEAASFHDDIHQLVMVSQITRIKTWHKLFKQHSKNSTLGSVSKGLYSFPTTRSAYCDEKKTIVYHDVCDSSAVLVSLSVFDMHKLAKTLNCDDYHKMDSDLGVSDVIPAQKLETMSAAAVEMAPASSLTSTYGTASIILFVEVEDFDWWYEGFLKHAHSTTGSWGFPVTMARADYTHEHRTRVFRGVDIPSRVAVLLYGVDLDTFDCILKDASFLRLRGALGEKGEWDVKVMSDEKGIQSTSIDCTKLLCAQQT